MSMNHESRNGYESIDAKLSLPGQAAMRDVVSQLPDEMPSMAWRSELNTKLMAEASRRNRRARFVWALRPAAGLAFAGALAFVFVLRSTPTPSASTATTGTLEAEIVTAHTQAATFADVAGTGVRPMEASYVSRSAPIEEFDWSEVDVENL